MITGISLRSRLGVVGLPKDIERRLVLPLSMSGRIVEEAAKEAVGVQGPAGSPGEGYFHKKLRAWVVASESPSPPHRQSGDLQQGITHRMYKRTTVNIISTMPYSQDLEYGRKNMRGPRPFMVPALTSSLGKILSSFSKFLGI